MGFELQSSCVEVKHSHHILTLICILPHLFLFQEDDNLEGTFCYCERLITCDSFHSESLSVVAASSSTLSKC